MTRSTNPLIIIFDDYDGYDYYRIGHNDGPHAGEIRSYTV